MTSLDSNSQATDSRSSSPQSDNLDQTAIKREKCNAFSSPDPVKFKKAKTDHK